MAVSNRTIVVILAITFLVISAIGMYGYFIEPFRLVVNHRTLVINNWDPEFDGFRVVLISDVHGGSHGVDATKLRRVVEAANAQQPDAIFLLGDHVSTTPDRKDVLMPIDEITAALGGLKAKFGVFAVLGNHEGWYSNDKVSQSFERAGIRVLNGKVALLERNGKQLRILGLRDHMQVDDWKVMSREAKNLLAPTDDKGGGVIVLEHSPDVADMITGELLISKDLRIMFAGHTHGGQFWLPIIGYPFVPSSYGQKFAAGHVKHKGLDVFVTTGVGTSLLPFRFMVPPEISVVTLTNKPSH